MMIDQNEDVDLFQDIINMVTKAPFPISCGTNIEEIKLRNREISEQRNRENFVT